MQLSTGEIIARTAGKNAIQTKFESINRSHINYTSQNEREKPNN